jgi:hypothetical protein
LKTNTSKNKEQTRQQRSAAHAITAGSMSFPAVPVFQPMSKSNVAQLYSVETIGKLSQGRQMLLQSNYTLFASGSKISEANGIGGDIGFIEGEANEHIGDLNEVIAYVKEGSDLEKDMHGYDHKKDSDNIKPDAQEKLLDADLLKNTYETIIENHLEDGDELTVEVSSRVGDRNLSSKKDSRALVKELVAATLIELKINELPGLDRRVDEYLEKQVALAGRPLMPTDCKAMSSYVAGFVAGSGDVDVTHLPVEAGDVYEYNAPDPQKAEWPFHYATVIMTDGGDHVTMENAAAKASEKFSKTKYDRSWFFEMYGAAKGQTFDDHYKPLLDPN